MEDYDFFIAHAGKDIDKATELYDLLVKQHSVFLDKEALQAGDNWATLLPKALEKSRVIILLLSKNSNNAYYLKEEMVRAIQLQRTKSDFYKIIPIYIDGFPQNTSEIPYGLYQIHSIDYLTEKGLDAICQKLHSYFEKYPESERDSYAVKDNLRFKHILHDYPTGPMVGGSLVPVKLIETFAEFIEVSESLQIIDEANAFRKQADPEETGSITIKKINLPHPNRNSPKEFWLASFTQARLHGPRMVAALLLSVEDIFFSKEALSMKHKLLNDLKQISL